MVSASLAIMSERMLVIAHLITADRETRDKALDMLAAISKDAERETGTHKYAVLIPREDDGKTFYVTEEYDDKAAFDVHMSSQRVKDMGAWLQSSGVLHPSETGALHMLQYLPGMRFTRDEILKQADPHVLFAELDYVHGGVETATPYWQAVVDTGRDKEVGTLHYGIARDLEKEDRLVAFEVYESPEYLKEVHVPSEAIQNSIASTKHLRTGLKHHALKKVGGFLHKLD